MRRKIQRLLHVCETEARAGVVRFRVQVQDLVYHVICHSREENAKVLGYVCRGVNAAVCLAVGFVLFVTDYKGTGEVEAALIELCFVWGNKTVRLTL